MAGGNQSERKQTREKVEGSGPAGNAQTGFLLATPGAVLLCASQLSGGFTAARSHSPELSGGGGGDAAGAALRRVALRVLGVSGLDALRVGGGGGVGRGGGLADRHVAGEAPRLVGLWRERFLGLRCEGTGV